MNQARMSPRVVIAITLSALASLAPAVVSAEEPSATSAAKWVTAFYRFHLPRTRGASYDDVNARWVTPGLLKAYRAVLAGPR